MNFEQNLFISYAHIDNEPLSSGEKGWITRFHATLKAILSMRLGREAKIWRDEKLRGNDVFSDEIVAHFRQSALLMSIVTPRYLNSDWCTREANEFCQSAERNGGLVIGNKSRVFKVIKTPVEEQGPLPPQMKDLLGFEFFIVKDDAPLELDPDFGRSTPQLYKQKVALLAQEIAQALKSLQASEGPAPHIHSNDQCEAPLRQGAWQGPEIAAPAVARRPTEDARRCGHVSWPSREPAQTRTRLRPACFASYSFSSARLMRSMLVRSESSKTAPPIDIVTRITSP